jgi:hypothetical protein
MVLYKIIIIVTLEFDFWRYIREHQRLKSFHDKISLVGTSSFGNRLIMNLDYYIPFKVSVTKGEELNDSSCE